MTMNDETLTTTDICVEFTKNVLETYFKQSF